MKARGIFPTLSGGFDVKPVTSKRSAKVTFSFTWSSAPLILQTDEIVVAFRGADSKSRYLPMDIYDTRLVARYFNGSVQTFLTEKK